MDCGIGGSSLGNKLRNQCTIKTHDGRVGYQDKPKYGNRLTERLYQGITKPASGE